MKVLRLGEKDMVKEREAENEDVQAILSNCPETFGAMVAEQPGFAFVGSNKLTLVSARDLIVRPALSSGESSELVREFTEFSGAALRDLYRMGLAVHLIRKCQVVVSGPDRLSDEFIDKLAAFMVDSYFERQGA